MIGVPYAALTGEGGLAWQVLSWGIILPLLLVGLWAWFVVLDRRFGWGLLADPLQDSTPATAPDELVSRNGHYGGAAENGHAAPVRGRAGPDDLRTLASWMPHPDDPIPVEAIPMPEEKEDRILALPAALVLRALPLATPQPVSTEARTRPRRRRRRRRLRD